MHLLVLQVIVFALAASTASADSVVLALPAQAPAFSAIERGIRSALAGKAEVRVILLTDAQGDMERLIASALDSKPACILPVGTGLSRAFIQKAATQDLPPIIGVAVTNARDVLENDWAVPRRVEATIVEDGPASIYPGTAALIAALAPHTKTVGTVWNPAEPNSKTNRDRIAAEAQNRNWRLVEQQIKSGDEQNLEAIAHALLAEHPDVIWIGKDKIMTSRPGRFIELAHAASVPVFASDSGTVEAFHAVGTRSVNFEDLGRFIGKKVLEVMGGSDVSNMPVSTLEDTSVFLSRPAVEQLRLHVPKEIDNSAVYFGTPAPAPGVNGTPWLIGLSAVAVFAIIVVLVIRHKSIRARQAA